MGNCGVGFAPVDPDRRQWLIGLMEGVEDIPGTALSEGMTWEWESFPEYLDAIEKKPLALDVAEIGADYLVSSANKCIEGVPGFAFVIARQSTLAATEGHARSLSLDLLAQWRGLDANGQFRFPPPTHALLAFHQAPVGLESEGGVAGR